MKTLSSVKGFLQKIGEYQDFSAKEIFYGLSYWIELTSPRLARQYLAYASELLEPQLLGRGFRISTLNDVECRVHLPFRWQNRTSEKSIALGTVLSLAEFALRVYLDRVFLSVLKEVKVISVTVKPEEAFAESVDVVEHLSTVTQAEWRLELQRSGELKTPMVVRVVNASGRY